MKRRYSIVLNAKALGLAYDIKQHSWIKRLTRTTSVPTGMRTTLHTIYLDKTVFGFSPIEKVSRKIDRVIMINVDLEERESGIERNNAGIM